MSGNNPARKNSAFPSTKFSVLRLLHYIYNTQRYYLYFFFLRIHTGVLEAEFFEADVEVIPITYPFATSHIWWPINQPDKLNIKFDFRSNRTTAVLAYGEVTTSEGNGFWEVSIYVVRRFFFHFQDSAAKLSRI